MKKQDFHTVRGALSLKNEKPANVETLFLDPRELDLNDAVVLTDDRPILELLNIPAGNTWRKIHIPFTRTFYEEGVVVQVGKRELDFHHLGLFNVFLFDGPHAYEDQFGAVMMADPALEPCFVLIVDDWNWEDARRGTMDAIRKRNYHIDYMIEVRTSRDNTQPDLRGENSDWHNGYFIGALRKTR